jgi:MYXO-CTERM domain-containing protein
MARSLVPICIVATSAVLAHSATALAVDCFVDNVDGLDTNNGTSDAAPFKSISKISSSCTTVKFKRGNVYNLATGVKNLGITSINSVKTITNYGDPCQPLPQFVKEHVNGSGGMIQAFSAITLDGLYLAGSKSANAMTDLAAGIGVMVGAGSTIQNCEITLCDIGIMTSGDNVKVLNNYIHDLSISVDAPPGVDPNQVGGAEGIFVNSSHVEVAYNRFINCSTAAAWVTNTNGGGVRCDGGATEVTVGYAGTVTDVHIHHNFSYNSCGLFEVSSMPNSGSGTYVKGNFTNSEFHDNVVVDSGWIGLLQINNTRLTNIRWENNTIIHHFLPTVEGKDASGNTVQIDMNDYASSYIQVIPFNSTSSGVTGGGVLEQGDVYWTNNLWYIDPAIKNFSATDATHASTDQFVKNIVISGDKVFREDPGFVDVTSQTDPAAYDLKSGSGAIDVGVSDSNITTDVPTDFVERARPIGNAYDLGAFEFGASNSGAKTIGIISSCGSSTGGAAPAGGAPATGGISTAGGTSAKSTSGATSTGGTSSKTTNGTSTKASGGSTSVASSTGGTTSQTTSGAQGGSSSTAPKTTAAPQGGQNTAGSTAQSAGGQTNASTSIPVSTGGLNGSTSGASSLPTGQGGNAAGAPTSVANQGAPAVDQGACSCTMVGQSSNSAAGLGLLGLLTVLLRRRRR